MMRYVAHNINNRVKVKLTEDGQRIVKERYSKFGSEVPIKTDEEGYTSFQTHEFMVIFGNRVSLGCKLPFDAIVLIETAEE